MRALASAVAIKPGATGFSCHDPTLAHRLRQAADQANKPAVLKLREASFNEGPAGVANAVKGMWGKIAKLASFGFSGDENDKSTGLNGRDLIALLATLGIDLGLFALTVINPSISTPNRNVLMQSEIAHAEGDTAVNLDWVRRHVIHHIGHYGPRAIFMSPSMYDMFSSENTASFLVIPNLASVPASRDGQPGDNRSEERRALALNQVAGVLTDANLICALSDSELNAARREMKKKARTRLDGQETDNIGLTAKANRALEMAQWSRGTGGDPEIFRLSDVDGLLPLLTILNEKVDADAHDGDRITPRRSDESTLSRPPEPANTNE